MKKRSWNDNDDWYVNTRAMCERRARVETRNIALEREFRHWAKAREYVLHGDVEANHKHWVAALAWYEAAAKEFDAALMADALYRENKEK